MMRVYIITLLLLFSPTVDTEPTIRHVSVDGSAAYCIPTECPPGTQPICNNGTAPNVSCVPCPGGFFMPTSTQSQLMLRCSRHRTCSSSGMTAVFHGNATSDAECECDASNGFHPRNKSVAQQGPRDPDDCVQTSNKPGVYAVPIMSVVVIVTILVVMGVIVISIRFCRGFRIWKSIAITVPDYQEQTELNPQVHCQVDEDGYAPCLNTKLSHSYDRTSTLLTPLKKCSEGVVEDDKFEVAIIECNSSGCSESNFSILECGYECTTKLPTKLDTPVAPVLCFDDSPMTTNSPSLVSYGYRYCPIIDIDDAAVDGLSEPSLDACNDIESLSPNHADDMNAENDHKHAACDVSRCVPIIETPSLQPRSGGDYEATKTSQAMGNDSVKQPPDISNRVTLALPPSHQKHPAIKPCSRLTSSKDCCAKPVVRCVTPLCEAKLTTTDCPLVAERLLSASDSIKTFPRGEISEGPEQIICASHGKSTDSDCHQMNGAAEARDNDAPKELDGLCKEFDSEQLTENQSDPVQTDPVQSDGVQTDRDQSDPVKTYPDQSDSAEPPADEHAPSVNQLGKSGRAVPTDEPGSPLSPQTTNAQYNQAELVINSKSLGDKRANPVNPMPSSLGSVAQVGPRNFEWTTLKLENEMIYKLRNGNVVISTPAPHISDEFINVGLSEDPKAFVPLTRSDRPLTDVVHLRPHAASFVDPVVVSIKLLTLVQDPVSVSVLYSDSDDNNPSSWKRLTVRSDSNAERVVFVDSSETIGRNTTPNKVVVCLNQRKALFRLHHFCSFLVIEGRRMFPATARAFLRFHADHVQSTVDVKVLLSACVKKLKEGEDSVLKDNFRRVTELPLLVDDRGADIEISIHDIVFSEPIANRQTTPQKHDKYVVTNDSCVETLFWVTAPILNTSQLSHFACRIEVKQDGVDRCPYEARISADLNQLFLKHPVNLPCHCSPACIHQSKSAAIQVNGIPVIHEERLESFQPSLGVTIPNSPTKSWSFNLDLQSDDSCSFERADECRGGDSQPGVGKDDDVRQSELASGSNNERQPQAKIDDWPGTDALQQRRELLQELAT